MDFSELEERPPTHTLEDPAVGSFFYILSLPPPSLPLYLRTDRQEKVSLFRLASLFSPFGGRGETAPKKSEEGDVEKEGEEEDRKERRCCAGGGGWFSNGRRKEEEEGVVRWENSILRAACQKRLAGRGEWKIGSSGSGRQWFLSRDSFWAPDTKILLLRNRWYFCAYALFHIQDEY